MNVLREKWKEFSGNLLKTTKNQSIALSELLKTDIIL